MILNSFVLFGHEFDGSPVAIVSILSALMGLLLAGIIVVVFIIVRMRRHKKNPAEAAAESDKEPAADDYGAAPVVGALPDDAAVKEQVVTYDDDSSFDVDVMDEDAVPEEDLEQYRAGRLSYDKSFLAKYIQSDDAVKAWYTRIKNELKAYEKVRERLSWRRETYKVGTKVVARIAIKGKTLCIYLALDPKNYQNSDYKVDDVSNVSSYDDTPCLYRVRSEQRLGYAFELIEDVMHRAGAEKVDMIEQDYYMPYETLSSLLERGLVKRIQRKT